MKKYYLHAGTYDFDYYIVIGKDTEKVTAFVRQELEDKKFDKDFTEVSGCLFTRWNYTPILWLPRKPKTPGEWGTFVHEVSHLVTWIMIEWAQIPLTADTNEAYGHLYGKIVTDILRKL